MSCYALARAPLPARTAVADAPSPAIFPGAPICNRLPEACCHLKQSAPIREQRLAPEQMAEPLPVRHPGTAQPTDLQERQQEEQSYCARRASPLHGRGASNARAPGAALHGLEGFAGPG